MTDSSTNLNQTKSIIDDFDVTLFKKEVPKMPITFTFQLDDFQKRSIYRIYNNQNVFVSAPTTAGKTIVALYGIAKCMENGKRAIYTSPIKALSNQKYREFKKHFGNCVGLLTGDITLNRDANILIMTTEILLSILYNKDKLMNDVEIVIFDEFHYIANQERGGVWEESVIHIPKDINLIFLSASMSNAQEIANWISRAKERTTYIEVHKERPVPLNHHIYTDNKFFTISNHQKKSSDFDLDLLRRAKLKKPSNNVGSNSYMMSFIWNLKRENLLPALIFEFSIKNIERKTNELSTTIINLLSDDEKEYVDKFFNDKVIKRIPEEDRELLQVKKIHKLLLKGIGVHHSGILPILREAIEILLNENYVKLVFCTSTIGMGLNLPVRTCCFTSIQKFNGKELADLSLSEYQQMSGRAGRRRLDDVGNSVICIGKKFPDNQYLKDLFTEEPEEIKSQFQINFKMLINSLNDQSEMKINEIMRKSFFESSKNSNLSSLNEKIEKQKYSLKCLGKIECPHTEINSSSDDIEDVECGSPIKPFIYKFKEIFDVNSKIMRKYSSDFEKALQKDMLVLYMERKIFMIAIINEIENNDEIVKVSLLSSKGETLDITSANYQNLHILSFPSVDPNLDDDIFELKDELIKYSDLMKINDDDFIELSQLHDSLISEIINSPCLKCESIKNHFDLSTKAENLRKLIKSNEEKLIKEEFSKYGCYLNMMKEMNYVNENDGKYSLDYKGKAANDIYGHEIISIELMFSRIFDDCTPEEVAALCSCLVTQRIGRNQGNDPLDLPTGISFKLRNKVAKMNKIVVNVANKMIKHSVPFDSKDFVSLNMNPSAIKPILMWAEGSSFKEIMKNGNRILEGQMVSIITKDFALLSNFSTVAFNMEDQKMGVKFQKAAKKIQRGIAFANSIYLD